MRLAIVVPRYGRDVIGGAEGQARGIAEEGARRGWCVEVWTTCAKSHYTWHNVYRATSEREGYVTVRRFPVTDWNPGQHTELDNRLAMCGWIPFRDEEMWLESGAHSVPLYAHIAAHSRNFDVVIAMPYAAPLVHYAAWAVQGARCVVIPCLHDEAYAYMEVVRLLLEHTDGVLFLSPEEKALAVDRLGIQPVRVGVIGGGLSAPTSAQAGRRSPAGRGLPYLLYVGRLEEGKNLRLLYDCVRMVRQKHKEVRLVVVGDGPYRPPKDPAFEYRGYVPDHERSTAYAGALTLCQPSLNESFSMTIMESWLQSTPVLVHADCPVTVGHVRRAAGGLYFGDCLEFNETVRWLLSHSGLAQRMGANGRQYVLTNYTWPVVMDRLWALWSDWGFAYA